MVCLVFWWLLLWRLFPSRHIPQSVSGHLHGRFLPKLQLYPKPSWAVFSRSRHYPKCKFCPTTQAEAACCRQHLSSHKSCLGKEAILATSRGEQLPECEQSENPCPFWRFTVVLRLRTSAGQQAGLPGQPPHEESSRSLPYACPVPRSATADSEGDSARTPRMRSSHAPARLRHAPLPRSSAFLVPPSPKVAPSPRSPSRPAPEQLPARGPWPAFTLGGRGPWQPRRRRRVSPGPGNIARGRVGRARRARGMAVPRCRQP